jgi:hypothetical protein
MIWLGNQRQISSVVTSNQGAQPSADFRDHFLRDATVQTVAWAWLRLCNLPHSGWEAGSLVAKVSVLT